MKRWNAAVATLGTVVTLTLIGALTAVPAAADDPAYPTRQARIEQTGDTIWKWFDDVGEVPPNADIVVGRSVQRGAAYTANVRVRNLRIYGEAMFAWGVFKEGDLRVRVTKVYGRPVTWTVEQRSFDPAGLAGPWTPLDCQGVIVRWDVFADIVGAHVPADCVPWMTTGFGDISHITMNAGGPTDMTLEPLN